MMTGDARHYPKRKILFHTKLGAPYDDDTYKETLSCGHTRLCNKSQCKAIGRRCWDCAQEEERLALRGEL